MRKVDQRYSIIIVTVFLILILSGCSQQKQDNLPKNQASVTSAAAKEEMNFRITWKSYSGRGEAIQRIVDSYNEQNRIPYQIVVTDGDEEKATIETLLRNQGTAEIAAEGQSGKGTDIYMLPYRYIQYFGSKNLLEDLTEEFGGDKDQFYPTIWSLSIVKGKLYGVPWLGHTMGLIYNKSLLEKAGVNPDSIVDLDSLVKACEQVEKSTQVKGIGLVGADHNDISWMVNQFIYGFGGSLVSKDGLRVTIHSEQSKEAIRFYRDVLGDHAQENWQRDTGVEVMDAFREQKIAFEIQGLWGITDVWKNGRPFESGAIPLERIGLYPEAGPMMVALPLALEPSKREAAVDFIRYLISAKAQDMIMEGEYSPEKDTYYPFRLPVRIDRKNNEFFQEYPEFGVFLTGFAHPSIDVPTPLWQEIKDKYYAPGLHQVMLGEVTIDDFLTSIEKEGNIILSTEE